MLRIEISRQVLRFGFLRQWSLLAVRPNLIHHDLDRVDDLLIRIGFAIDDHLMDAGLGSVDVDVVTFRPAIEPARRQGARRPPGRCSRAARRLASESGYTR